MSDSIQNSIDENYKGRLQEYCHLRNLGDPTYEVTQHGSPNEPSWSVEIQYGQARHITPEALRGSKRFAEQMAAKQALDAIELRQEAFLAGSTLQDEAFEPEESEPQPASAPIEKADLPPVDAPVELVASALNVASQRVADATRRNPKYRETFASRKDYEVYARDVAELTVQIVRELITAAESNNVEIT